MADVAAGRNCPQCGTLVACAGDFDSPTLVGVCPVCNVDVEAPNIRVENGKFVTVEATETEHVVPEPEPIVEPAPEPPMNPAVDPIAPDFVGASS